MIRWCQADQFWSTNILSSKKLRANYDQMRKRAMKEEPEKHESGARPSPQRPPDVDDNEIKRRSNESVAPPKDFAKSVRAQLTGAQ